ncbi:MAG: thiamine phosphate synthase [Candidatus Eremiobacteraeota bacterium]|nr:thiamine phosphate synthase [Candidatus Eremiobacteraeota bacterium]
MARVSAAAHRLRGIYAIVDAGGRDPVQLTEQLLDGGIRIVQYRAKGGVIAAHARAMRDLTNERNALFIINDEWRAVETFDADGVHLGPDDAYASQWPAIRRHLRGRILGVSCGSEDEARTAQAAGADYIGVGCVFPTKSKSDAGDPIGVAGLERVAAATSLPVAAIGGINLSNIAEVYASGVAMAALISALSASASPRDTARQLVARWNM